jgi:Zn finger protein HypA/HybF involved in hydrogenase expression
LESKWSNIDGNDFSEATTEKARNIYYQKQLANEIMSQVTEMISLLTSILNIHLNIGQNLTMNTSEVFMSLETISMNSLSNKKIQQVGNAQIHIPSNFTLNLNKSTTLSIRVCFFLCLFVF